MLSAVLTALVLPLVAIALFRQLLEPMGDTVRRYVWAYVLAAAANVWLGAYGTSEPRPNWLFASVLSIMTFPWLGIELLAMKGRRAYPRQPAPPEADPEPPLALTLIHAAIVYAILGLVGWGLSRLAKVLGLY